MKAVLSPNPYRDRGLKAAQSAEKILRSSGVETAMCLPFPVEGSNVELPKHIQFKQMQTELKDADLLICFGGDGTILHAAKDANAFHVPILGVNLGSVGFMAELELGELSVGKAADLFMINVDILDMVGALMDPMSFLGTIGYTRPVEMTMVAGKVICRQGRLVNIDEDAIKAKGKEIVKKVYDKIV